MQFLLIAYDGTDPEALNRRLKVREDHLEKIKILVLLAGIMWCGIGILLISFGHKIFQVLL